MEPNCLLAISRVQKKTSSPTFRLSNWSKYVKAEFGPSWGLGQPKNVHITTSSPSPNAKISKLLRYIHGMMFYIFLHYATVETKPQGCFFWILIELFNLHVWSGGETHRRRAWLHRFLFHHGSSSVNHTLLQQFSTKLLFNTSLQHSSPTLLFDALSDLLLPQPSSPTLVYNIASIR